MVEVDFPQFDTSDSECPYDEEYMAAEAADGFDERLKNYKESCCL